MLKSRGLKWNKYPHREKWRIANLKDEPGKRPLGSSTARRKLTKTSTLIRYCPPPIRGRETQPSQCPALPCPCEEADQVRREFNPLGLADAGSGGHPPSAGCRQAQASSLLKSQEGYLNTRHSGEQTAEAKATLVTVPAPGPLAAPA